MQYQTCIFEMARKWNTLVWFFETNYAFSFGTISLIFWRGGILNSTLQVSNPSGLCMIKMKMIMNLRGQRFSGFHLLTPHLPSHFTSTIYNIPRSSILSKGFFSIVVFAIENPAKNLIHVKICKSVNRRTKHVKSISKW